jgi:hypothetical protein
MSHALRQPSAPRRSILINDPVVSDHPPIVREYVDEDGYTQSARVRDAITTGTQVNCRVFNPDGAPVARLYGTQGQNPSNGTPGKVGLKHDKWAHGTGSTSSAWS